MCVWWPGTVWCRKSHGLRPVGDPRGISQKDLAAWNLAIFAVIWLVGCVPVGRPKQFVFKLLFAGCIEGVCLVAWNNLGSQVPWVKTCW